MTDKIGRKGGSLFLASLRAFPNPYKSASLDPTGFYK